MVVAVAVVVVVVVVVASFVVAFVVVFVGVCGRICICVCACFLGELHCSRRTEFLKGRPRPLRVGASTSPDGWWSPPRKQVKVRVAISSEVSLEVLVFQVNECAVR